MPSVQLGRTLDIGGLCTHLTKLRQQRFADIGMRHLTATEPNCHLDAVSVLQELQCALDFYVKVIGVDAGRHTDFLDLSHMLVLLGLFFLLGLLKAELAIVHDLAHRRGGIGGDLYQIQSQIVGLRKCISGRHDAKLFASGSNYTDFLVSDILVELMV